MSMYPLRRNNQRNNPFLGLVLLAFSHGAIGFALSGSFKTNSMEASDWLLEDFLQLNFWQKYQSHQNRTPFEKHEH